MSFNKSLYKQGFLLLAYLLLLVSCDLQKRKYNKGYYFNRIAANEAKRITNQSHKITAQKVENFVATSYTEMATTLTQNDYINSPLIIQNCDTIFLNNGVTMFVKVLSVGDEKVIYKNCESTNDASYTLESSKVISIHYADGNKITLYKTKPEEANKNGNKQYRTFKEYKNNQAERGSKQLDNAIAWLGVGVLFGPAMIVGFILAALAREKLKNKDGYEQRFRLANTITIVGGVILALSILLLLFLIIIFGI